jgi:hypothetical protein
MKIGDIVKDKLSNAKHNKHKIVNIDEYKGETVYQLKDLAYISLRYVWRYEKDIEII